MVLASQRAAFPFARSEFTGLAMTAEKKAREAIGDGALRVISDEEFLQRFREGSVQRLSPFVDPDGSRALNPYNRDFLCIPEKARADAERRAKYIDGIVAEAGPPPYSDRRLPELTPKLCAPPLLERWTMPMRRRRAARPRSPSPAAEPRPGRSAAIMETPLKTIRAEAPASLNSSRRQTERIRRP